MATTPLARANVLHQIGLELKGDVITIDDEAAFDEELNNFINEDIVKSYNISPVEEFRNIAETEPESDYIVQMDYGSAVAYDNISAAHNAFSSASIEAPNIKKLEELESVLIAGEPQGTVLGGPRPGLDSFLLFTVQIARPETLDIDNISEELRERMRDTRQFKATIFAEQDQQFFGITLRDDVLVILPGRFIPAFGSKVGLAVQNGLVQAENEDLIKIVGPLVIETELQRNI